MVEIKAFKSNSPQQHHRKVIVFIKKILNRSLIKSILQLIKYISHINNIEFI